MTCSLCVSPFFLFFFFLHNFQLKEINDMAFRYCLLSEKEDYTSSAKELVFWTQYSCNQMSLFFFFKLTSNWTLNLTTLLMRENDKVKRSTEVTAVPIFCFLLVFVCFLFLSVLKHFCIPNHTLFSVNSFVLLHSVSFTVLANLASSFVVSYLPVSQTDQHTINWTALNNHSPLMRKKTKHKPQTPIIDQLESKMYWSSEI